MAKKIVKSQSKPKAKLTNTRKAKSYMAVVVLLSALVCGLFFYIITQPTETLSSSQSYTHLQATSVTYTPDANGNIEFKELGIVAKFSPELTQMGLIGVYSEDESSSHPSKRITFTTKELAEKYEACDAVDGWIGAMTRYEGASAAMGEHNHVHGSTNFDYSGFHINYLTPLNKSSCVARVPGYDAKELGKETVAARKLWDAMLTAKPL